MTVTLDDLVDGTLERLDDSSAEVYSRDEIRLYAKDGYNLMCRRAKPIFDIVYVENLPAVGNWSSEEEFELAKQVPGLILTGKRNFTREIDRALAQAGSVGPAALPTHAHIPLLSLIDPEPTRANPIGQLPHSLVEIERVAHDQITIFPEFSTGLAREHDNRYESQGGDPDWFTVDKDGLFTLRRFPSGDGMADYGEVRGSWGIEALDELLSVSHWSLDETTGQRLDDTGSYHLEQVGNVGSGLGTIGAAAKFLDDASYLRNLSLRIGLVGTRGIVWRAWVKRSANPPTIATILSSSTWPNPAWGMRIKGDGSPSCFVRDITGNILTILDPGPSVCDGNWHLFIMSYNQYADRRLRLQVPSIGYNAVSGIAGFSDAILQDGGGILVGMSGLPVWPWGEAGVEALIDEVALYDAAQATGTPSVIGDWGAIAHDPDTFPSGGPWGTPTRLHPDVNNTRVEITRLGRDLDYYPVEVPKGYVKYIEFWACSRALKRDGPGQDLKLAEHYARRFDKGVRRLKDRVHSVQAEHTGRIGQGPSNAVPSMSIHLPYAYGRQRRKSGRY